MAGVCVFEVGIAYLEQGANYGWVKCKRSREIAWCRALTSLCKACRSPKSRAACRAAGGNSSTGSCGGRARSAGNGSPHMRDSKRLNLPRKRVAFFFMEDSKWHVCVGGMGLGC